MTFLNPLLLFGMAAIAAPIIIHMFMNRRIKRVVWAAMRFLQASVQKNQKRMEIEDLLLLALRCLILVLLALALARPVIGRVADAGAGKGGETAVIALDNSYSMGQSDSSASRFDQARKAAEQVIDSLPSGSSVAVLLFSDVVRASIAEPTYDLNLARKVVRDAALSDRSTDVQAVMRQAMETLGRHASASQGIYLITDGQAAGWKKFNDITGMLRSPTVKSRLILVGDDETHNLGIKDLRQAGTVVAVGDNIPFDVEVGNFGAGEAKDVPVRIAVDGDPPCDEGVIPSIPAGGSKHLTLFTKFRTPGYHTATAQINPDHLTADDRRTIAVRATDDLRILLVDGDSKSGSPESATFFLRNALVPVPAPEREQYAVKTKIIAPEEMGTTKLDEYEAVVLADVPSVSASALEALAAYLNRGGGLIVFPGPKTNAGFYNENLGKKFGFLPATLGAVRGEPDQTEKFFSLQGQGYTHPIVSLWNDPGAGTLAGAHFYRSFDLKPVAGHTAQAGEAQVVLKFGDGSPAMMERTWGRGRVILFASSANTAWNDLAVRPAFLPLIDRTLWAILDRQDARLNISVGFPFEFVCDPDWVNKDAILTGPGDKSGAGSLRRIGMQDGVPMLHFEETEKAGAYEARIKTDPPQVVKFAVQSNAAESNLEALSPTQLEAVAATAQVIHWTPDTHLEDQFTKQHGGAAGADLWIILTVLVIAAACVELVLAGLFSATK